MSEKKHQSHPGDTMPVRAFSLSEPTTHTFVATTPSDAAMAAANEIEDYNFKPVWPDDPGYQRLPERVGSTAAIIDRHFAPLREELARVQYAMASTKLALAAEEHNHRKDNEYLLAEAATLRAENAKLRAVLEELFVASENAGELLEEIAGFSSKGSTVPPLYEALRAAILNVRRNGLLEPKSALP